MTADDPPLLWQRRRALGAEVLRVRRVYLDVRFWGDLCDAALGENTDATLAALHDRLRGEVQAGRLVCPIEFHVLAELLKQRLPAKRRRTAEVIDALSRGVAVVMPPERVFLEVLRFTQASAAGPPFPAAPADEVWTKMAYLVGHGRLKVCGVDSPSAERLNRLFEEHLWGVPLADVVDALGPSPKLSGGWTEATVAALNAAKRDARDTAGSYRALYLDEVRGVLDGFARSVADVTRYLFHRAGGDEPAVTDAQAGQAGASLVRVLHAGFATRDLALQLPTVHVLATLFARVQWDGARRYRANDLADFGHAAAALAYCDAFATERSLASLVRQAKLDQQFGTAVLMRSSELLRWLDGAPVPS